MTLDLQPALPPPRHHCPVKGCERVIEQKFVMCPAHWREVPYELRDLIWRLFRTDQGGDRHRAAIADAIDHVNELRPRQSQRSFL